MRIPENIPHSYKQANRNLAVLYEYTGLCWRSRSLVLVFQKLLWEGANYKKGYNDVT